MAIGTQDIQAILDLTAETSVSAADIMQTTDTAKPANDRGLVVWSQDSALNTPIVPQAQTTTDWQRYTWRRVAFNNTVDADDQVINYHWNPFATSDATLLKWERIAPSAVVPASLPPDGPAGGDLIGSTYPDPLIAANKVTAGKLKSSATVDSDRAVTSNHIRDAAVTSDKIAAQAVTAAKIFDGSVSATKLDESARGDVQQYATATLAAGVYSFTLTPAPAAYTAGQVVRFKVGAVNTGATNLNVNGLGERDLLKNVTQELAAGDIPNGMVVTAVYDGTSFQMQSNLSTINSSFTSAEFALGSNLIANPAHGLGALPTRVRVVMVCKVAEGGYSIDDELDCYSVLWAADGDTMAFSFGANLTNVFVTQTNPAAVWNKSTSAFFIVTPGNWRVKIYASL